jgi:hypothetical protein
MTATVGFWSDRFGLTALRTERGTLSGCLFLWANVKRIVWCIIATAMTVGRALERLHQGCAPSPFPPRMASATS